MAIATMVNRSGFVASRKRGRLDSSVASFASLAAMRRIVAADSSSVSRATRCSDDLTPIALEEEVPTIHIWLRGQVGAKP